MFLESILHFFPQGSRRNFLFQEVQKQRVEDFISWQKKLKSINMSPKGWIEEVKKKKTIRIPIMCIHRIYMLSIINAKTFINVFLLTMLVEGWLEGRELNTHSNISVYVSLTITIWDLIFTLCFPINKLFFLPSNFPPLRRFSFIQIIFFP